MAKQMERIVNADRVDDLIAVFGSFDENIKRIEEALDVQIINRGTDMKVSGAEYPIRLVYEVALQEQVNEFTMMDVVSETYLAYAKEHDHDVSPALP